jgi:hypothetical protein
MPPPCFVNDQFHFCFIVCCQLLCFFLFYCTLCLYRRFHRGSSSSLFGRRSFHLRLNCVLASGYAKRAFCAFSFCCFFVSSSHVSNKLVGNNSKVFIERANVWHVFSKNLNLSAHPDVTYQANFTIFLWQLHRSISSKSCVAPA